MKTSIRSQVNYQLYKVTRISVLVGLNETCSHIFAYFPETESSTVTRHKNNNDISHRGTAIVSDYLPVPAPLYRVNQTSNNDQLNGANLNLEDLDAQLINPPTNNYDLDDVSDLANPVVAAITNLKTMPPASSTYPKTVTARPTTSITYLTGIFTCHIDR